MQRTTFQNVSVTYSYSGFLGFLALLVYLSMTSASKRGAPQPGEAPGLTRRALFDLRLAEMRRRGEPTDGMLQQGPTVSESGPSITDSHRLREVR